MTTVGNTTLTLALLCSYRAWRCTNAAEPAMATALVGGERVVSPRVTPHAPLALQWRGKKASMSTQQAPLQLNLTEAQHD